MEQWVVFTTTEYALYASLGQESWVNSLSVHSGWGKEREASEFPSTLPSPSYRDMLAFSSTSDANNRSLLRLLHLPFKGTIQC